MAFRARKAFESFEKRAPGPSSTSMAGHSRNPAVRPHAWRLGTVTLTSSGKK